MLVLVFFLFQIFLINQAKGDPWGCEAELTTVDLSNGPVYIPSKTNVPLQYKSNMHCYWGLNISPGKYATVKVLSNFPEEDYFLIYNNQGYKHSYHKYAGDLPPKLNNTFYLPGDQRGTYVELQAKDTKNNGFLSLVIEEHDLPRSSNADVKDVNGQNILPLNNLFQKQMVFTSDKNYVYRVASEIYDFRFDACFVYSGKNPSQGQFLTGLASQSFGVPKRFTGPTTVICLGVDFSAAYLVAVPAPASMSDQSIWIFRTGDVINEKLNALNSDTDRFSPAYLTTYCPNGCTRYLKYVNSSDCSKDATLDIYDGSPAGILNKLESIKVHNGDHYVPQQITNVFSTFVVSNGQANLGLTMNGDGWETARIGRKGFFATSYISGSIANPVFSAVFRSDDFIGFSYTVGEFIQGSVKVSIDKGNGNINNKSFTPSDSVQKSNDQGKSMTIVYVPPANGKVGSSFVSFEMTKSATTGGFIFSMLFCFLMI